MIILMSAWCLISPAQTPQYTFSGGTVTGNVSPFGSSSNTQKQWLFNSTNFTPAPTTGFITTIYFRTSASPTSSTYTDLLVMMGHTTLTGFTPGPFITAGMDTAFYAASAPVTIIPSGPWLPITLQTPFFYDGTSNFIVSVSRTGFTSGITIQQQTITGRSLYGPKGTTSASVQDRLVEFGFDLLPGSSDIGLEGFVNLPDTICEGTAPVTVTLKNHGPNTVAGATIEWKVNGVAQPSYSWSGSLAANATTNVTIGSYPFAHGINYSIIANSKDPNGVADTITHNDTILKPEIIVKPSPSVALLDSIITICQGDTALISGTLTGTPPWDLVVSDGTTNIPVTNITNPLFVIAVTPTSTKTYSITSITDGTGCENTSAPSVTVSVQAAPPAVITPLASTAACAGDSVILMASIGLNFSYTWYKDGVVLPGDTTYVLAAKTGGDYSVLIANPIGCSSLSAPVTVTIHPLPAVFLGNDTAVLPGTSLLLDAGSGFNSYLWSTGATSQSISVDSSGTGIGVKTIWVNVTDNYYCPGGDTININFTNHPGINEAFANAGMQVIPNPSDGRIELLLENIPAGSYEVELFSPDGKLIYRSKHQLNNNRINLDLSHVANGVYLLKVTGNAGAVTERIIIGN